MKSCHRCGNECSDNTVFCEKCGAYLDVCDPDAAVKDLDAERQSIDQNKQ